MKAFHRVTLLLLALVFALGAFFPGVLHDTWDEHGHTASRCRLTGETVIHPKYVPKPMPLWNCLGFGGGSDSVFRD